jgi:hypothetical protein
MKKKTKGNIFFGIWIGGGVLLTLAGLSVILAYGIGLVIATIVYAILILNKLN